MPSFASPRTVVIRSAEAICALGGRMEECLASWRAGRTGLTLEGGLLAGRIADRACLAGRRYGAASNLAVAVARQAVAAVGWGKAELKDAALFAASSRGNLMESLGANGWRRPSRRFSASNTLHSEIAASVSIELGIHGPWQLLSNGCSSGLDALGLAWLYLRAGLCQRALVVAVDLPLVPGLIHDFRSTHLLDDGCVNDPYGATTAGLHLGEGAAALTLELATESPGALALVEEYAANSDAYDSLAVPKDGRAVAELLARMGMPDLLCPHATGTQNHAEAEAAALAAAYPSGQPPLLLLKPFTGHTLGASGLLDAALMAAALEAGVMPMNLPGLTTPAGGSVPVAPIKAGAGFSMVKLASGMGGHNAAVRLRKPGA